MKAKLISENTLSLLDAINSGRIFFIEFKKKDGTLRRMTARRGVSKGVTGNGRNHNPRRYNNVGVYDMDINEFRMFTLHKADRIHADGVIYCKDQLMADMINVEVAKKGFSNKPTVAAAVKAYRALKDLEYKFRG